MALEQHIRRRPLPDELPPLAADLHPVLARVFAARAVRDPDELQYELQKLLPYQQLKDIDRAVDLLIEALQQQQRVLIVGDFDADGATSTALSVAALQAMGLKQIDYLVPNRFKFGYGLTPEIVEVAREYQPDLIITVDNGIASLSGVEAANAQGIKVLITDHHLAGEQLPAAEAILNPNQPDDTFPSKALPGVGVMFYLLMALRARLRELDWFEQQGIEQPNLAQYLDLVALGTVADLVPLDRNNRILVAQGLARLRAGQARPGIRALIEVAGRTAERLSASDIGFFIAPRLNAAGRMDDMSHGIECLLAENEQKARELAQQLDNLNRERRGVEATMKQDALQLLDAMQLDEQNLPHGLCLFDENWHEGVVGILASRVKEQVHRPVIAFAATANGEIKGSARSVRGLHIRDALDAVATRHPDLISRFGGHAMAAGLSLPRENFEPFAAAFDAEVRRHLDDAELCGEHFSDGPLAAEEMTLELAEAIRQAGPWGQGFEEPLFDGEFELVQRRIVGEHHLKMVLRHPEAPDRLFDAIAFNHVDHDWPVEVDRVELVYQLDVNEYRGQRNLQLLVRYLRPVA
ncbi:single-stranded-DNA-specific exonuclease RecJ [Thiohalophilus sp.]|uniref:single-stranded-DNA-specific exonuclease RecJ n=1 Tax=Thiohalophilus sp. TaxID=3028392 RepID=UPI002ACD9A37|nr:single-stranded-DNA-specific exonuclease RecJ [Thiohalophilus sp.]MDZ7663146.1 single-stranded-DNA-specific exonuclease RecJ [Thiohalophilus sp.]